MHLNKQELAEMAAQSKLPTKLRLRFVVAGSVIGVLLLLIFNERALDESADYYNPGVARIYGLLVDFLVPASISGVAGAVAGYGVWCAVARQSVGPKLGAIGWAIFAGVVSTIAMKVIAILTSPSGEFHGSGIPPDAGHLIIFAFLHFAVVLPIAIVVGAVLGWRWHRR